MKKRLRPLAVLFIFTITVVACVSPITTDGAQPSSSNDVATMVSMTLQALAPQAASAPTSVPESTTNLLPQRLYFLSHDSQSILQVFRLERDGRTKTQLTFEPTQVWDYTVSPADGNLAYEVNSQLVLVNADGSNRRTLIQGAPNAQGRGFYKPVFSPDGKRLAYARGGLNVYDLASGVNAFVLEDHPLEGSLPPETYAPASFSPDGTKLLLTIGHPPDSPFTAALYTLAANVLSQFAGSNEGLTCCNFYGGAQWTADSSSFYSVASQVDSAYKFGELWRVEAASAAVTTMLTPQNQTINLPEEPYLAPDGQLYFFLGTYSVDSGFFDAPALALVRSAPDGVTGRTVLRNENFVLMNEALWAPDASFVIVATRPARNWDQAGGVLELYPTDGQKGPIWLASFGQQMQWGP